MKNHLVSRMIGFCLLIVMLLSNGCLVNSTAYADANTDPYQDQEYINSKDSAVNYLADRLMTGCPIASFETDDKVIENAAYSYDNALAALAFIADDKSENAGMILDSIIAGIDADRFSSDRLRNAYMAGDPTSLPGFWDDAWFEDAYQVGSSAGNSSMMALAMMQYYTKYGGEKYITCAKTMMDWVLSSCNKDKSIGFIAGYNGWPENGNTKDVQIFTYKTTWHNIAAYAAFKQLHILTKDSKYLEASENALAFVESMHDEDGYFHVGTKDDGKEQATYNIALTAQFWPKLALGKEYEDSSNAIAYAEKNMKRDNGYKYSSNAVKKNSSGFWCEGTAFAALAFRMNGDDEKALSALEALENIQNPSGSFPAASVEQLYTGESILTGKPLVLNDDPYLAPTAWYVMAICGFNPFTFDLNHDPTGDPKP
jgi:hypothetical protein